MAMGGAFIGLANDATSSEFNPAGIFILRSKEIAAEYVVTHDEYDTKLLWSTELLSRRQRDLYSNLSFVSLSLPFDDFAVSVSRFTNISFDRTYPHVLSLLNPGQYSCLRTEEMSNQCYGFTLASGLPEKGLSIGTTFRYNVFRYELRDLGKWGLADEALSANFGLHYRMHPKVHLGAVYKSAQKVYELP